MTKLVPFASQANLQVCVELAASNGLEFDFIIDDPTGCVDWSYPEGVDKLYEHSCFEIFMSCSDCSRYVELNLSARNDMRCYWFDDYRRPVDYQDLSGYSEPKVSFRTSQINVNQSDKLVHCRGRFELDSIAQFLGSAVSKVGLSVILKHNNGERSYWALKHSSDKPDFHDSRSFQKFSDLVKETRTCEKG